MFNTNKTKQKQMFPESRDRQANHQTIKLDMYSRDNVGLKSKYLHHFLKKKNRYEEVSHDISTSLGKK